MKGLMISTETREDAQRSIKLIDEVLFKAGVELELTRKELVNKKAIHKMEEKTMDYRQFDDCVLYEIACSCGKKCGGWTPQQAEADYAQHTVTGKK